MSCLSRKKLVFSAQGLKNLLIFCHRVAWINLLTQNSSLSILLFIKKIKKSNILFMIKEIG